MRRFIWLWALVTLCSIGLASWDILSQGSESTLFPGVDRQYLALKMKWRERFFPREPSDKLEILSLPVQHPLRFWKDQALKKELALKLRSHTGPIIMNLSPYELWMDPIFQPLFEKSSFVRGFDLNSGTKDNFDQEVVLSYPLQQKPLMFGRLTELSPDDPNFLQPNFRYGLLSYIVEEGSHLIYSFKWLFEGSGLLLPHASFQAFSLATGCQPIVQASALECWKGDQSILSMSQKTDLYFYKKEFKSIRNLSDFEASDRVLFVTLDDGTGKFSNLLGKKIGWAELNATAVSNLFQNDFWKSNALTRYLDLLLLLLLYLSLSFTLFYRDLKTLLTFGLVSAAAVFGIDLLVSMKWGFRTQPIDSFFAASLLILTAASLRSLLDVQQRSVLEKAFKGYVSESRLNRILSGKESLNLEGRKQKLAILILDIVGFSKISEEVGAEASFELVKKLYALVDPIILKHHGVIDKKLGDGMICFFGDQLEEEGDPQVIFERSVQNAVDAACEIQNRMPEIQDLFSSEQTLQLRIGVNSGEALIGNAGSEIHFDYTVLGHTVNFTQRLEAACTPGCVLLSESTFSMVKIQAQVEPKSIRAKNDSRDHLAYEIRFGTIS